MSSLYDVGFKLGDRINPTVKRAGKYTRDTIISPTGNFIYKYSGTKKYIEKEDFGGYQKLFLFDIILICFIFIGVSISYMLNIFSNNTMVVKNKDKNDKIVKNLIVSS